MRRIILLLVVIFLAGTIYYFRSSNKLPKSVLQKGNNSFTNEDINPNNAIQTEIVSTSVFVPYWSVEDFTDSDKYDREIYFGLSVNEEGMDISEIGYLQIDGYLQKTPPEKRYLAIRMLNNEKNIAILENSSAQDRIIAHIVDFASRKGFEGLVLDLEMGGLPLQDVRTDISSFVERFSQKAKEKNLTLAMTIYGHTYFRGRPYDIKTLSSSVDEFMIMAYDFHKARGEPGPNFPLSGREKYGYDFQQMITDFSADVPSEKLTVIFGMYGYDWTLGPQGLPLKQASAITLGQIENKFFPLCDLKDCVISTNPQTAETNIKFTDEEGYQHVIWYEDEDSVVRKIDYLKEQGIGSIAYWAWGYW